jgi:hypothetical protein
VGCDYPDVICLLSFLQAVAVFTSVLCGEQNELLVRQRQSIENKWIQDFEIRAVILLQGARGSVVVKTLCYKPEGSQFESR